MSYLTTQPQLLTEAAANVAGIRSSITQANAAAAGSTTSVMAAASDEVSAAAASFFGAYGQEYQAAIQAATAFHDQFTAALASAGNAYAGAEIAIAGLLGGGGGAANAAADFTLVMGGSGTPIPPIDYINNVVSRYIASIPGFDPLGVQGLFTPEGGYPIFGFSPKDLTFDVSVQRGVDILNNQLVGANPPYAGLLNPVGTNTVNVLGYSQSAIISSLEMKALNPTNTPAGSPYFNFLNFSLIGDPMNPNGGLLERFSPLSIPSIGLTFYGATPDNSFHTTITTLEYDGFADFPQYPLNVVSDLNAFAGILYVHGTYPTLTATQLASAIHLTNTVGPVSTDYYMIPTQNLPILNPIRSIPLIGTPFADLIQPDLKVIVDLGYGSTTQGWSPGPPNVPTPFGVIPPVSLGEIGNALATAAPQGVSAFMADLNSTGAGMAAAAPATLLSLQASASSGGGLPSLLSGMSAATTSNPIDGVINGIKTANTTVANFISGGAASLYGAALPTTDIANFLVTTLPSYDVNLFLGGIEQMVDGDPTGGLIYALGAPFAADTALGVLAGGFELEVILKAVTGAI
ncbi:MAG: PE family protein [Mycobacterium sp.]